MNEITIKINNNKQLIENYNQQLIKKLEVVQNLVKIDTDDQFKLVKQLRADLNKERISINNNVKKVNKQITQEISEQVNEQTAEIEGIYSHISTILDEYEQEYKTNKMIEIEAYFNKVNKFDFLKFDDIFENKWLNRTYAIEKIEHDINELIHKTEQELKLLFPGELEMYENGMSLTDILSKRADNMPKKELTIKVKIEQNEFPILQKALSGFEWEVL